MSTIEKIAVYDARIIQEAPRYGVQKGALAVSVSPFNAQSASASNMNFQVLVPSLNVFVDRKIDLLAGANVYMEAVPSQYTNYAYTAATAPSRSLDSGTSFIRSTFASSPVATTLVDPECPSANAVFNIDTSHLPSYTNGQITGGSTIGPFPVSSLILTKFRVLSVTSGTVLRCAYVSGLNPAYSGVITLLDNAAITYVTTSGNGSIGAGAVAVAIVTAGTNVFTITTVGSNTGFAAGDDVSFVNATAINETYTLEKVVPINSPSLDGRFLSTSPFLGLRAYLNLPTSGASPWATWGGFAGGAQKGSATIPIATLGDRIQEPQIISTPGDLKEAVEVITAGGRGKGINSGFLLERGSFAGCTGPTNSNWYQPIGGPQDVTLGLFPVQSLITNIQATINDATVNINGDVLKETILLAQTRASLMQRTTNSKFDVYSYTIDDVRNANGATQTYGNAKDSDIGNGSWKLEFLNPNDGKPLKRFDQYTYTVSGTAVTVYVIDYRPVFIPMGSTLIGKVFPDQTVAIAPTSVVTPLPVMFRFTCSEPLCVSPFLWQDAKEMTECGIYGCTNLTFNFQFTTAGPQNGYQTIKTIAGSDGKKRYVDKLNTLYPTSASIVKVSGLHALFSKINLQSPITPTSSMTGPWTNPRLMVTFLTPPPDVTLPLVSTVPYAEFPRYFSPATLDTGGKNSTFFVSSNTVTLSSIPDFLAIFVKPNSRGQTQNEMYVPIENVGVTFDNYSNLCSNFAQEDLYAATKAAGLDMDWQQFRGYTTTLQGTGLPIASDAADSTYFDCREPAQVTQLTGGPLLLRMGQDIPLSPGLAPGTLGNFSVQVNLRLDNRNGFFNYLVDLVSGTNATVIIMAVNSGFFETVRGQSAVRKTILNSVDVEAASVQTGVTSTALRRMVGGGENGVTTSSDMPIMPYQEAPTTSGITG